KKFNTYNAFSTEITLPNKITSHIKKMREDGFLTFARKGKKIIVEANKDILKQMADKHQYKIDKAIEMLSYIIEEVELAYQPHIKTFRDSLDVILYFLWGIFQKEKSFYSYYPIVSILFYVPNIKEKEKIDFALRTSTERWENLITIPQGKQAQKSNNLKNYLMKNNNYLKDFLFLIADCLDEIEHKYLAEKGTHHFESRLLISAQINATRQLLNNLQ
ncbi:MAG: hypothetical protein U9O96_02750, partial [Candidatus Thermoplasmatota archaeon]|nr:hypothetical protein [Candidatus Thermoplasmatota archaeon]